MLVYIVVIDQIVTSKYMLNMCFLTDRELSGKVAQFCGYLNQIFPDEDQPGPLYLLATDSELKHLLMELISKRTPAE